MGKLRIKRRIEHKDWTPWEQKDLAWLQAGIATLGLSGLQDIEAAWVNNLYSVQQYSLMIDGKRFLHLMVRRHDEGTHIPWSHLQRIKNELIGEERWAVQTFPAEEELVDQANLFHLFVYPADVPNPFTASFSSYRRQVSKILGVTR